MRRKKGRMGKGMEKARERKEERRRKEGGRGRLKQGKDRQKKRKGRSDRSKFKYLCRRWFYSPIGGVFGCLVS
jgi:hypothetical protein